MCYNSSRSRTNHHLAKGESYATSNYFVKKRPFGVTLLAILAGVAAVLTGIHALQALGIFPYAIGPVKVHAFNLWNAFMWGLMVWVWVWLIQVLLAGRSPGLAVPGGHHRIQPHHGLHDDDRVGHLVGCDLLLHRNPIILIYVMLPGTKRAFGTAK